MQTKTKTNAPRGEHRQAESTLSLSRSLFVTLSSSHALSAAGTLSRQQARSRTHSRARHSLRVCAQYNSITLRAKWYDTKRHEQRQQQRRRCRCCRRCCLWPTRRAGTACWKSSERCGQAVSKRTPLTTDTAGPYCRTRTRTRRRGVGRVVELVAAVIAAVAVAVDAVQVQPKLTIIAVACTVGRSKYKKKKKTKTVSTVVAGYNLKGGGVATRRGTCVNAKRAECKAIFDWFWLTRRTQHATQQAENTLKN